MRILGLVLAIMLMAITSVVGQAQEASEPEQVLEQAQEAAPPVVTILDQLTAAFAAISDSIATHDAGQASVELANDAEARAQEALTAAQQKSSEAEATADTGRQTVLEAFDAALSMLSDVRDSF